MTVSLLGEQAEETFHSKYPVNDEPLLLPSRIPSPEISDGLLPESIECLDCMLSPVFGAHFGSHHAQFVPRSPIMSSQPTINPAVLLPSVVVVAAAADNVAVPATPIVDTKKRSRDDDDQENENVKRARVSTPVVQPAIAAVEPVAVVATPLPQPLAAAAAVQDDIIIDLTIDEPQQRRALHPAFNQAVFEDSEIEDDAEYDSDGYLIDREEDDSEFEDDSDDSDFEGVDDVNDPSPNPEAVVEDIDDDDDDDVVIVSINGVAVV